VLARRIPIASHKTDSFEAWVPPGASQDRKPDNGVEPKTVSTINLRGSGLINVIGIADKDITERARIGKR